MAQFGRSGLLFLLLSSLSTFPAGASAQAGHYWTNQFGNESVLLNGTVIGSVTDLGAVYYNPARLVHRTDPSFVVSAKLYEWTTVNVEDGLGESEDLKQSSFGGAPGFLAGTFTVPFLEGHQFAYAMLTRERSEVNYFLREQRSGDLYDFLPGGEDHFVGTVDIGARTKDDWIGVAWAYPFSSQWSVGVSGFYFNRSTRRSLTIVLEGIAETLDAAGLRVERQYEINDQGILGKVGVGWQGSSLSWGLTGTTPYWRILGDGTMRYENFQVGVPGADGSPANVLESSVQGDLPVEWRTPWSVGTGLGWSVGDWVLHGSVEYFSAVHSHDVLKADPVLGQSTGEPIDYTVVEQRRAVLNGGIGARWRPSESLSAFASVATNFSPAPDTTVRITDVQPTVSDTALQMDFLLVGGGVSVATRWADLTIGGTWQGASEPARRLLNLPEEGDQPESDAAKLVVQQFRLVFGFSIPFRLGDAVGGGGGN